jgi:hypothetical protein
MSSLQRCALCLLAAAAVACSSSSSPVTPEDAGATDTGTAGPDTWKSFAQGFTATYCVHCHNATTPAPSSDPGQNFNLYADVKAFASEIRCGVAPAGQLQSGCKGGGAFPPPGQFPAGAPYPDDAQRLRMIAWINAGAPEGE